MSPKTSPLGGAAAPINKIRNFEKLPMKIFALFARTVVGAIACCALLCSAAAEAAIIVPGMKATISLGDRVAGASWSVTLIDPDGNPNTNDNVVTNTNLAGLFRWTAQNPNAPDLVNGVDSLGNPVLGGDSFISFCIEITQTISSGTHTMDLVDLKDAPQPGTGSSPMNVAGANAIAKLWNTYLDDALLGLNPVKIGAFQLAVWKLVYDETDFYDLSKGRLRASNTGTNTVGSIAQDWLNSVAGLVTAGGHPIADDFVFALTKGPSKVFQDQLVGKIPPPEPTPSSDPPNIAPEATSIAVWALLSCLIGVVGGRRRDR